MSDINKFILNEEAAKTDPDGHLFELGEWSEESASKLAAEEGIQMTDEHWEVVRFLRDDYREHGNTRGSRALLDALTKRFDSRGGKKHLYLLFPNGPVTQGCKIAGLPLPEYSRDTSFGTAR
jgi:tRNA 2-thiouridine synthesizing protein E